MRVENDTYSFPLKLFFVFLMILGILGVIFTKHNWFGIFIPSGLLPLGSFQSIEFDKDKRELVFYKHHFWFFRWFVKKLTIPAGIEDIVYLTRYYDVRMYLGSRTNFPGYKTKQDYWIYICTSGQTDSIKLQFIDYMAGYKIAQYLARVLDCKLIEKDKSEEWLEESDEAYYTRTGKDKRLNFNRILRLSKKR
jgi:hypothetical protein